VKKKKKNDSNSKFKNLYFPGSKNYQKFIGARSNRQEHRAITKTQQAIKDCSQKFKQSAVLKISKNFMARDKHQKISKKYLKLTI
jgi:hypothetical protein